MNTTCIRRASVFAAIAVFAAVHSGHAQLRLSPTIMDTRAFRGSTTTLLLGLGNSGKVPLDCKISVSALTVTDSGMPRAVETAPRSCHEWLKAIPASFTLAPEAGQRVQCRLQVPKDAGGGYYAAITIDAIPQRRTADGDGGKVVRSGVRFSYRNMAVVMVTVPAPGSKAIVQAGEPVLTTARSGSGYLFQLPVRNQGNLHARMKGTVEIRSEAGQVINRHDLTVGRGFLLPEHERVFPSQSELNLPDGAFIADVRLEALGFNAPDAATVPFTVQGGKAVFEALTEDQRAALHGRSAGFAVAEPHLVASLRPGGRTVQAIELRNLTKESIPISARILYWDRDPSGVDLVPSQTPGHGRNAAAFVSMRTENATLRPLSRQRFAVQFSLPKEASGEYYAAVLFERDDQKLPDDPQERARRSTLLTVRSQSGGKANGAIARLTAQRQASGIVEIAAVLRNPGVVSFSPDISFALADAAGTRIGKLKPTDRPAEILAGGTQLAKMSWERILPAGEYTVIATLRFSPQQPPVVARTTFTVPEVMASTAPVPAATH